MKQIVLFSCFCVALAFALPLLLYTPGREIPESAAPTERTEVVLPPETMLQTPQSSQDARDAQTMLAVLTEQGVEARSMADYLPLALAGEMPASFEPEALKAQAVALRSYALYYRVHRKSAHPDADVCCSAGCCAACADISALREAWGADFDTYMEKCIAAVRDTDGQYLVWEDAPALAVFHASSAVQTEDGAALGVDKRYLVSVETPETAQSVRNLLTTVEVSADEFSAAVHTLAPEADLSGAPDQWVGHITLDAAGRVEHAEIGGAVLSGLALRQLFSLRSTDFTLGWTDGHFLFRVRGYGHGLGMSQHGANLMAAAGADYTEILSHYYPGTSLALVVN